jgi:signal transduction histidine kinase
MLYEFVTTYREEILANTRAKVTARSWPAASAKDLEHGVPIFLTQLSETLRSEATDTPSVSAIGTSATLHGRDLLALGLNVSQVVHVYGDICQAVTELALEQNAPITTDEFHSLNRCLDTAIAEAVTEHARITAEARSNNELERLGQVAHEVRDILNTALLAFHTLKSGTVAINGSTGAVLGRSLMNLRDFVDSTLADTRLAAQVQRHERILLEPFLHDIAIAGGLHAEYRGLQFCIDPVESHLAVVIDPQLLRSAVMNLLNNAFKFTRAGGRIQLRARHEDRCALIEVEDECGGIPASNDDPFQPFGDRRGNDRTGLGLGLSIARKAVRAHHGDIHIRNLPGKGCIFVIAVPLAAVTDKPVLQMIV